MFVLGLLIGFVVGVLIASLFAVGSRQKGIDDANALADAEEAREREPSG